MEQEFSPLLQTARRLAEQLAHTGIASINEARVLRKLQAGEDSFMLPTWTMVEGQKAKVKAHFAMDASKEQQFTGYELLLFSKTPVHHGKINGIDTKELEEKMTKADWFYATRETSQEVENNFKLIKSIEKEIFQLTKSEDGLKIATQLWMNHVDFTGATKPKIIQDHEEKYAQFVKMTFAADVSIDSAYQEMKERVTTQAIKAVGSEESRPSLEQALYLANIYTGVLVEDNEFANIRNKIAEAKSNGDQYVAFFENTPTLSAGDITTMKTTLEIREFQHENQTDRDFVMSMPLEKLERQISNWQVIRNDHTALLAFTELKLQDINWNYKEASEYYSFCQGETEIKQAQFLVGLVAAQIGVDQAKELRERLVPQNSGIEFNFPLDKKQVMGVITEQEMMAIRNQYGKIGISDAFTPEVMDRIRKGETYIEHPFEKTYPTGDHVKAIFHLEKSKQSNLYFLNKWDSTVKPDGSNKDIKETFYNNDLNRIKRFITNPNQFYKTYKFKASVNYLAGRAVENTYHNLAGQVLQQWNQGTLINGKMVERTFHPNYGFDLQKLANNYKGSIKVLSTEYESRFYDSLRRGNLESTEFVEKNGQLWKYSVTPNIPVGCFDVYSTKKEDLGEGEKRKLLTPEQQAERGFISQEFAQKIRERLNEMQRQKEKYQQTNRTMKVDNEKKGETTVKQKSTSQQRNHKTEADGSPPATRHRHRHT